MRKILIGTAILLLVILTNFSLWFVHTRTINDTFETIKRKLMVQGIEFTYKEIRYTNFLAWEVKAVVYNPSFKRGNEYSNNIKKFEKIDLVSTPISNRIIATFPTQFDIISSHLKKVHEYTIQFKQPPILKIKLFSSLANLDDAINIGDIKYGKYIKEVFYYNDIFDIIDKTNQNQIYATGDNFSVWVVNKNTEDKFTLGLRAGSDKFKYHPNYTAATPSQQRLHSKHLELGNMYIEVSGMLLESFDGSNDELSKKVKGKDDYNTKKIELENIRIGAKPFTISLSGKYEKLPIDHLPFVDLQLSIHEYKSFVSYYASTINLAIEDQSYGQAIFPIKKISEEQTNAFAGMLKKLSLDKKNENDVTLEILRTKKDTTISGKPVIMVIKQLQALFLSNLPALTPQYNQSPIIKP